MREVVILGAGMTRFGKFPDRSLKDLAREAVLQALDHSAASQKRIEAAYCGNAAAGLTTGQEMLVGQVVLKDLGIVGIPVTNVENACASGSTAIREAWIAVAAGLHDVVLVLGIEKLYADDTARTTAALATASDIEVEAELGFTMAANWALRARRYMNDYKIGPDDLALVAVKNSRNGALNPLAQYQRALSLDDVLQSRMIVDPLTLLQCSPIADGAAAVVLCDAETARQYTTHPVFVAAAEISSGTYEYDRDITVNQLETRAALKAYERAGIGPEDVRMAEVHDCFTIAEFLRCESLLLCPRGEYARYLKEGLVDLDGRLPVNPGGGLLSRGHPIGATGVAQVIEIFRQMHGEAGARQASIPKVGLTNCSGGGLGGDTGASSVILLKH